MMEKILRNKAVYIISPHFDDAALSCWSLMSKFNESCEITVINIFTKAHSGPYTLSAKRFLKYSGTFKGAEDLFERRAAEDKDALQSIKVGKVLNLDLIDSLFRKRKNSFIGAIIPEFDHYYPIYRLHMHKNINAKDDAIFDLINKLSIHKNKNAVYFVPYAVGGHVDHKIARAASEDVFENIIYYSDFPYNVREGNYGSAPKGYKRFELKVNTQEQDELLKKYETQYKGLFSGNKMPQHAEVYFVKTNQ